jgi:hypothetical protein
MMDRPTLRGCGLALPLALTSAARAQPVGGVPMGFATYDAPGRSLTLRTQLGTPAKAPEGAEVVVHASGLWGDHREGHDGRAPNALGHAALAVDALGPRGNGQTTEDRWQLGSMQMARDPHAARRFLVDGGAPVPAAAAPPDASLPLGQEGPAGAHS